jgi:23S rRNA pseudouridine1911/1915/1917 synthase
MTLSPLIVLESIRLDQFLVANLRVSRQKVQYLIRNEMINVNRNRCLKPGRVLSAQDEVIVTKSGYEYLDKLNRNIAEPTRSVPELNILYEDSVLMVIFKPAGEVVHPGVKCHSGTTADALIQYDTALQYVGGDHKAGLVHRLDKNTAGIMVIAKTADAHAHLSKQFKTHQVTKQYYAMVSGNMQTDYYDLHYPIGKHPKFGHLRWVIDGGRFAQTYVHVMKRYNTKTWIKLIPVTGRTHQLRVHLAYLGHPIIGDPEYGPKRNATGQQLVAYYLNITHPHSGIKLGFKYAGGGLWS